MGADRSRLFTSESVTEGHPDKVADYIVDSILDAYLERDPRSRVACEALCKSGTVVLAGEITSTATDVDLETVVRQAIRDVGYADPEQEFSADNVHVEMLLTPQAVEIGSGVGEHRVPLDRLAAGDQGMMFGYASDETPELMPLPILLAHRLTAALARHRSEARVPWLGPDGKSQVSVEYRGIEPVAVPRVLVAAQHDRTADLATVGGYLREVLVPEVLGRWSPPPDDILVNTAGTFHAGGPTVDSGLSGRKGVVDSYGGMARIGGGSFSGKDPSKVDRSGAYFTRYVARRIVEAGIAKRVEIQVAYAIGRPEPFSLMAETFGTGSREEAEAFMETLDFRPGMMIQTLGLLAPLYRRTTNYGHFGRPGLPWEASAAEGP